MALALLRGARADSRGRRSASGTSSCRSSAEQQRTSFDTLPDVVPTRCASASIGPSVARCTGCSAVSACCSWRALEPLYLGRGLRPLDAGADVFPSLDGGRSTSSAKGARRTSRRSPTRRVRSPPRSPHSPRRRGCTTSAIFRFESMCFEAQKLRLVSAISPPHDEAAKARIAHSTEHMTDFEKKVVALSQAFSGFFAVMPFLRDAFKGPRFDQGYPELLPTLRTARVGRGRRAQPPHPSGQGRRGPHRTAAGPSRRERDAMKRGHLAF